MRPPRLDLLTLKRGMEKLSHWTKPQRAAEDRLLIPSGLNVIDAKMWPWMKHRWDRHINRNLLTRQLKETASGCVAITTIPIVADLIGHLPVDRWIYYCVDDFSVWPGLDGTSLLKQENKLLDQVDEIICVSETLRKSVKSRGRSSTLLTHGVDLEFWQHPKGQVTASDFGLPSDRPIALFWGVIDRRMNADWLIGLADDLSDELIALAGPVQDPDPRILNHPKIQLLGPVAFDKLPSLAKLAHVLIMPYADLPVTRAMQPLKLKEYLATLRPVVVSPLPAVEPLKQCVEIASTQSQFLQRILSYLQQKKTLSEKADAIQDELKSETWKAKAELLSKSIHNFISAKN